MGHNPRSSLTSNEELLDALIRHQTFLMRGAGSIRIEVISTLNETETALAALIRESFPKGHTTIRNLRKAFAIEKQIRDIRHPAWIDSRKIMHSDFEQVIINESAFMANAVKTVAPVIVGLKEITPALTQALLTKSPFEGKTLLGWGKDLERADLDRINSSIKVGIQQGESGPQIARRVLGTIKQSGRDGVTQMTRRQVETVVLTAMNFYSNQAKEIFARDNSDIIKKELYVATLDNRTTAICRSLDGKIFKVGEGQMPPLHMRCRSLRVAILNGEVLGIRLAKFSTEKGLLREFTAKENIASVSSRKRLPRGTKGKFDKFSRQRIPELTGTVPAKTTYAEFLTRQSVEFQNDTLGVKKAQLFRKGNLKLDRFVARDGSELTLAEISIRDPQAFRAAGLNPDNFN